MLSSKMDPRRGLEPLRLLAPEVQSLVAEPVSSAGNNSPTKRADNIYATSVQSYRALDTRW